MANRKPDEPPKGAPAWQTTFSDLMNLLLCFFVLLFSMSTIDEVKQEKIVASFNQMFSVFDAGASAIGDGILISNGVSQLNELDEFINSTGRMDSGEIVSEDVANSTAAAAKEQLEEAQMEESEALSEKIQEAVDERDMADQVEVQFTAQFVQLTLKGSLLFDSGSTLLKDEAKPVLDQVGLILERYAQGTIEIEGHTDNVPMSGAKYSNNDELSSGRALSVFDYILSITNLNPANIKHAGRGEYLPVADNSTPEGRAKNGRVEAMKKKLISVIILALLIVNIVLTAIMMFSVTSASKKTAALVDSISMALNLELASGEGGEAAVSMADTETYSFAENMTIPLKKSEGDEKDHYCIISVTLSINTKADVYKKYGSDLSMQEGLIKDEINSVFAQYTMEEARDNQDAIKKEILNRIQKMFDSNEYIYNVSFGDIMFG